MKIKWVILVILIVMILAGTVSAQETVRRARQSSEAQKELAPQGVGVAQPDANIANSQTTFGFRTQYTTKTGPQEFQIPISVYYVNDLANMDLSIRFAIDDEYQTNRNFDFGKLRIKNVEKGSLIDKSLFDSSNIGWNEYCEPNTAFSTEICVGQMVNISFVSSEGISGNGPIAIITYTVDLPSDSGTYIPEKWPVKGSDPTVAIAYPVLVNAHDTSGNPITFQYGSYGILLWKSPVKGDGDGDGAVTGKDAVAALAIAVGKQPYNPNYNMNLDGKVDSTDVLEILKMSLQSSGVQQGVMVAKQGG